MTEWRPDRLARRLPHLEARARLLASMRRWFAAEGFLEVETPILQVAPGAEVHLTGFATEWELPDGEARERWLHSSPEFAMKKLLAGGLPGSSSSPGCSAMPRGLRSTIPSSRCSNGTARA